MNSKITTSHSHWIGVQETPRIAAQNHGLLQIFPPIHSQRVIFHPIPLGTGAATPPAHHARRRAAAPAAPCRPFGALDGPSFGGPRGESPMAIPWFYHFWPAKMMIS
jgi:hypothetical protein